MLRRNLIANFVGQGWVALINLAFIPVYIEYLGIEAYGLIGMFAILQTGMALLDMGMTPTLNREMSRYSSAGQGVQGIRDLLRTIEIIAIGIVFVIIVGMGFSSNWLATSWVQDLNLPVSQVKNAFVVMGFVLALRFFEGIYRSCIIGLQKQVLLNVMNCILATFRAVGVIGVLAWVSPTIEAFFLWQAMTYLIGLCAFALLTYLILPESTRIARFSTDALKSVAAFAGGMIGTTFLSMLLTQIDKIMLSRLLPLSEYGYYTLAATVAGGLFVLIAPVVQAWFPRLCELHAKHDQPGLIVAYHKGAQIISVVAGSAAIVLIMYPGAFLKIWTQDSILAEQVAPLLSLLMLGNLLNGLMHIPYQTQLAHGWTELGLRTNLVAVIVVVPAIILITPRYGAIGAAFIWVLLNIGYVLFSAHFMFNEILKTEKWTWYKNDVIQPLGFGFMVAGFVKLAWEPSSIWGQCVQLIGVFLLVLICSLFGVEKLRSAVKGRLLV